MLANDGETSLHHGEGHGRGGHIVGTGQSGERPDHLAEEVVVPYVALLALLALHVSRESRLIRFQDGVGHLRPRHAELEHGEGENAESAHVP